MQINRCNLKDLSLPLIAAPMFLISQPAFVMECCKNGVIGTFPSLNARNIEILDQWLTDLTQNLGNTDGAGTLKDAAPFGVNLIVHKSNQRIEEDKKLVAKHKIPIVITSVGHPGDVVEMVHSYGGIVLHDVINMHHAQKAIEAGVDGVILVCAGAGGHGGLMNPFTFVPQVRKIFDGLIILSGTLSSGQSLRAAEVLGANFGYMGTRFIATQEAPADEDYKQMILQSDSAEIVYTDKVSGINGNFMKKSLLDAGVLKLPNDSKAEPDFATKEEKKAWKQVWSAGQGVGEIRTVPTIKELVATLKEQYKAAANLKSDY